MVTVIIAVVVTTVACTAGAAAALALDAVIPAGSIPFEVTTSRIGSSVAILLVAAVLGSAFSFRRIASIDPATAIGGGT